MKHWRKARLLLLATVLAMLVAGCSNGSESGDHGQANSGTKGTPIEGNAPVLKDGKYDPPVVITTVRGMPAPATYKNGESADDNVHYRWAKEKLGIEIKNLWSVVDTNNAYDTKVKLALSSNESLPDVLIAFGETAQLLMESGKFQDAGELFDKYAGEAWKKAMAESPTAWYEYTRDGKRLGIPVLEYEYNFDPLLWAREDWMNKLGLQPPKTLDDYERMLDAFANGDPDGNGKKDTYGAVAGFKNSYADPYSFSSLVFGAYGAMPDMWLKNPDGSLAYGSVQPQIKPALAKLKEWVSKGYIPKEASIWDVDKAGAFMASGRAGSVGGPYWADVWPIGTDLQKNTPGAQLATYEAPTGPDGGRMIPGKPNYIGGIFINKNMKNPEIFFTYGNYLYDNIADPKPGSEWEHGWAKGYDWDIVDGEPTYDFNKIPGGGVRVFFYSLLYHGPRIPSQNLLALNNVAIHNEAQTPYEKIWSGFATPLEMKAAVSVWNQRDSQVKNLFTGGNTPTMKEKWDYLRKIELETYGKIVFGSDPVDAFDAFVEQWKSQGGEQITKEVNEWYKSVSE